MSRASSSVPSSRSKGKVQPYPDEDAVTRQMLMDDDAGLFKPMSKKAIKALFAGQKKKAAGK